jgi:hypothetical protein
MFMLGRLAEGLIAAHFVLALSLLAGLVAFPWPPRPAGSPAHAMLRVVCTCAAGFALIGFALFLLAIAGLLRAPFVIGAYAAILILFSLLNRRTVANFSYWRSSAEAIRKGWDAPAFVIYGILLAIALPAVVPNYRGDPVAFHLPYAEDWARAGGLVIDPFLRFPFYAHNFLLFFSAFFVFHADALINFLPWAMALLTALGICASARIFLRETMPAGWAGVAGVALTLSVVLSAGYLRWLPLALMDVGLGAFALISALCLQLALLEEERRWLIPFAVATGFLIGMKASFLILLPLFALALFMTVQSIRPSKRFATGILCLLGLCSAPWYIRNFALAGDAFPPVTNIALYGYDPFFTKGEWRKVEGNLSTGSDRSAQALFSLPVRAFLGPEGRDFDEFGITALFLLLPLPPILVLAQRFFIGGYKPSTGVPVLLLSGLVVYWLAGSTLLRYTLLFYPLLAVCVAACAGSLLKGRFAGPIAAAVAILAMWPSPSPQGIENQYDLRPYNPADARYWAYPGDDAFLRNASLGYKEETFTSAILRANGIQGLVYISLGDTDQLEESYFFRRDGILSVSDVFGPAAYWRLETAIDTHEAPQFLNDLGVVAVEIPGNGYAGLGVPLERALESAGFCRFATPETATTLLVKFPRGCANLILPAPEST